MSTLLVFIAGAAVGGTVAWLIALRFAAREPVTAVSPPVPDEMLASDTATHLASAIPAESTFEPLAHILIERCSVRVALPCALVMREKVGAAVHISAVAGGLDTRLLGIEVPLESPAGRAITDNIPVAGAPDEKVVSIDRRDRRRYSGGGVAVPLSQGGLTYGAVVAFGEPPAGTQDAIEALTIEVKRFVPVLVPAFSAAVQAKRAETDDLTGLPNRRAFTRQQSLLNKAEKASLVILDIDHFKDVNDSLGHQAGDAALRHIARVVRQALRPKDTLSRIGGEEFAIWMPGADLKTGEEVAERVRSAVADSPFRFSGTERVITVSCGVASYPSPTKAIENLMGVADSALYQAKHAGRNRVVANAAAG